MQSMWPIEKVFLAKAEFTNQLRGMMAAGLRKGWDVNQDRRGRNSLRARFWNWWKGLKDSIVFHRL
jgi:hypothetical protein